MHFTKPSVDAMHRMRVKNATRSFDFGLRPSAFGYRRFVVSRFHFWIIFYLHSSRLHKKSWHISLDSRVILLNCVREELSLDYIRLAYKRLWYCYDNFWGDPAQASVPVHWLTTPISQVTPLDCCESLEGLSLIVHLKKLTRWKVCSPPSVPFLSDVCAASSLSQSGYTFSVTDQPMMVMLKGVLLSPLEWPRSEKWISTTITWNLTHT